MTSSIDAGRVFAGFNVNAYDEHTLEHIGRARSAWLVKRADHRRVPTDPHGAAELVRRVAGGQLLLLAPDATATHKHIRRARRANHRHDRTDPHAAAEPVADRRGVGGQLLLLAPDAT